MFLPPHLKGTHGHVYGCIVWTSATLADTSLQAKYSVHSQVAWFALGTVPMQVWQALIPLWQWCQHGHDSSPFNGLASSHSCTIPG